MAIPCFGFALGNTGGLLELGFGGSSLFLIAPVVVSWDVLLLDDSDGCDGGGGGGGDDNAVVDVMVEDVMVDVAPTASPGETPLDDCNRACDCDSASDIACVSDCARDCSCFSASDSASDSACSCDSDCTCDSSCDCASDSASDSACSCDSDCTCDCSCDCVSFGGTKEPKSFGGDIDGADAAVTAFSAMLPPT